jgi:NAD(P)-dependent dehydrogenase (short-subunit alcohol dehydrogenase family)
MDKRHTEVVVVTGGTAGIGRATVEEFARHGAAIAILAREPERLEAARAEAERLGAAKAIAIPTDTADYGQVEAAADRVERELGPIDIWVNDAMATIFAPIDKISPDDFRRVTEVTYHGFVWGTMVALKRMRPRNRGTIVQVSSALAHRSIPLQSPYCGAKHAIRGFTESVRTELLHDKSAVHIVSVDMPGVNTPQFDWCKTTLHRHPKPMGPYYQPEVAARAVYFAAHSKRREIYVGMPSVLTIIGEKIAPSLLDRYLGRTGYDGQHTQQAIPDNRPSNLWKPVPGPYAAHGTFDKGAIRFSPELWMTMHRNRLLAGGAALGIFGALLGWRRTR